MCGGVIVGSKMTNRLRVPPLPLLHCSAAGSLPEPRGDVEVRQG